MNKILKNAVKMTRLIDDLLAFSMIGKNDLEKTKVSMKGVVLGVCQELIRSEESRPVDLKIGDLPEAMADAISIKQVWENLISNAVKYTRYKEKAVIQIDGKREGDIIVYRIADNGAGFDMEYYDDLFVVFKRLHSLQEFDGTGVGLAIVERIVLKHGGKIWAQSEPDKGAEFFFSLPA